MTDNPIRLTLLQHLTYHESAHALAAHITGCKISRISLSAKQNSLALVDFQPDKDWEAIAVTCLAGPAMEIILHDRGMVDSLKDHGSHQDVCTAMAAIEELIKISRESADDCRDRLKDRALDLLLDNLEVVQALFERLHPLFLANKEMTGSDAHAIIENALQAKSLGSRRSWLIALQDLVKKARSKQPRLV